jgi:hypothetical protein
VHTTPEQCLMSITAIERQAQGMRAGEVIAKLAEDAYFMRVDNRVTQAPPVRNRDNEATSRSADLGRNCTRAELPANPNRTRATAGGPSQGGNSAGAAGGDREIIPHRDPGGRGSGGGSSNHGLTGGPVADLIAAAEATRTATPSEPRMAASTPTRKLRNCDGRSPPLLATTTASPPSLLGFATYSSRTNSNLWGLPSTTRRKTPSSGSGATPSPSRTLVATTTRSASTSPSVWTKLHSHGSSHSRSTQSTSGTSSRSSSPATSRALWAARVLAWT